MQNSDHVISTLVSELLEGSYESKAHSKQYYPTLVVGLGGTGCKTLRCLKKELVKHSLRHVALIGIDTDRNENSTFPQTLPPLADSELVLLESEPALNALERAAQGDPSDSHVLDYLPSATDDHKNIHNSVRDKILKGVGAGQFRRAGKLLFCENITDGALLSSRFNDLSLKLRGLPRILREHRGGHKIAPGIRIMVVTSLAGGTGAGVLIDCLGLLRTVFQNSEDKINILGILPGHLLDTKLSKNTQLQMQQTRGSAIGVIRELMGFKLGKYKSHEFNFRGYATAPLGTRPLFDDIFLVDHRNMEKVSPANYMELCEAMGRFMYALTGSGVGMAAESGAINDRISDQSVKAGRIFNSLGVGSLEYPVEIMLEYGIRKMLENWGCQWLAAATQDSSDIIKSKLTRHKIRSFEQLRNQIAVPKDITNYELTYLPDPEQRKQVLKKSDDDFILNAKRHLDDLSEKLKEQHEVLSQQSSQLYTEISQTITQLALSHVPSGSGTCRQMLNQFSQHFAQLRKDAEKSIQKTGKDIDLLKTDMAKKAKKIHFWDFYLDRNLRKTYIQQVNRMVELRTKETIASYHTWLIESIDEHINQLDGQVVRLSTDLNNVLPRNERALQDLADREPIPGISQWAMTYAEIEQWFDQGHFAVPDTFSVEELSLEEVLTEALRVPAKSITEFLKSLNLWDQAQSNDDIMKLITSLNLSSEPLMSMISARPSTPELKPQKFVAGNIPSMESEELHQYFHPVGRAAVTMIQHDNPSLITCIQTNHGYASSHWSGFEQAKRDYLEDPWWYHTLPMDHLPELHAGDEVYLEGIKDLALALAFDCVIQDAKGALHWNFAGPDEEGKYAYLVYQRDRTLGAKLLLDSGLVKMPPSNVTKISPDTTIGSGLDKVAKRLRTDEHLTKCEKMNGMILELRRAVGRDELLRGVEHYLENMKKSFGSLKSTEKQFLQEMTAALKTYVSRI
jgi:hypothetical protein